MQGQAVVAGVGESVYYERGKSPDTEFVLTCKAIRNAVADAGVELADVDGFVSYMDQRNDPLRLARALGVRELRWSNTTWAGGGNNAAAAVQLHHLAHQHQPQADHHATSLGEFAVAPKTYGHLQGAGNRKCQGHMIDQIARKSG